MSADVNTFAPNIRPDCTDDLTAALRERIMVIDGAMGELSLFHETFGYGRTRPATAGSGSPSGPPLFRATTTCSP